MEKKNKKGKKKNYDSSDPMSRFTYLGLLIEDKELIYSCIEQAIENLNKKYPGFLGENEEKLKQLFTEDSSSNNNNTSSPWKQTKHFHLTTLFKPKTGFDKSHPAFTNFKEDKPVEVEGIGIIIIPNKIITLIAKTDEYTSNKFPHITLILGEYKPKDSNEVLTVLFDEGCPFESQYKESLKGEKVPITEKVNLSILDNNEDVYIYFFPENIKLNGKMKGFKY